MPTADMHGGQVEASDGGIKFTDAKGNAVAFETCKVGTLKELETATRALATSRAAEQSLDGLYEDLKGKLAHREETCVAADAAYTAEKEKSAKLETERCHAIGEQDRLAGLVESEKAASALLQEECDDQNEHWREEKVISAQLRKDNAALGDVSGAELAKLREELETVKAECDKATDAQADLVEDAKVISRQLGESQTSFDTLRSQMIDFLKEEKTGIDAVMQLLEKLAGDA